MQTESALLRLPPTCLLARPSRPRAELGAKGTGADPQGHYSTTIPAPAISSSSQGRDLWGPSHHPLQAGPAQPRRPELQDDWDGVLAACPLNLSEFSLLLRLILSTNTKNNQTLSGRRTWSLWGQDGWSRTAAEKQAGPCPRAPAQKGAEPDKAARGGAGLRFLPERRLRPRNHDPAPALLHKGARAGEGQGGAGLPRA